MTKRYSRTDRILESLDTAGFKLTRRTVAFDGETVEILYIQHLTDRAALSELVIKPLVIYFQNRPSTEPVKAKRIMENVLYTDDGWLSDEENKIHDLILSGMAVILLSTDDEYITVNLKRVERRAVEAPELQYTLRGPRDAFVENLDTNLSLVRYRVKDPRLRIKFFKVGKRTKQDVAMLYIEDIANQSVVRQIQSRIERINVDGIGESGELQHFLTNSKYNLFPRLGSVERSDEVFHLLMEGKVVILMDGSPIAISAPKVFAEFFHSCDDRYDNVFFGMFMRIFRYLALFIALTSTSFFVGITTYHINSVPSDYVITLAQMRSRVPWQSLVGALILEFIVELIRESLLRVPRQIGSAIGIVGAIVIGQAAISAGVFSPLLMILVSVSLLASFAIADFTLANPFRILKFFALLLTGTFGFYGLLLFISLILINLISAESFGTPYFAPFSPYNTYDFIRAFIYNVTIAPKRHRYLRTRDVDRTSERSKD